MTTLRPISRRSPGWLLLAACLLLCAAPRPAGAEERDIGVGPLSLRAAFPLEWVLPSHEPLAASVPAPGEFSIEAKLHHANTLVRGGNIDARRRLERLDRTQPSGYATLVDTEGTRLSLEVGWGLKGGWEAGVTASAIGYSGGFGDGVIEQVHETLDVKRDSRDERPRDGVDIAVIGSDGSLDLDGSPTHLSLGDTLVWARRQLSAGGDGRSAWLVEAAVELPTGARDKLAGSGGLDGRVGVHGSEGWRDRHFLNWGVSRVLVGDYEAAPLPVDDAWHAHLGYEYAAGSWSFPAQVVATDSHFGPGDGDAENPRVLLQAGVRRLGTLGWEIGMSQNLTLEDNNSDFALVFGVRWSPTSRP